MTLKVFCHMSDAEFCAYRIGRFESQRDAWMHDARVHKLRSEHKSTISHCVQVARERNRELVKDLRKLRELKKPQRKRQDPINEALNMGDGSYRP